jgi:hypothetical protein
MIRRHWLNFLIALAAFGLLGSSSALAQSRRYPIRAYVVPTFTRTSAQQGSSMGFGIPESLSGTIQMVIVDQNLVVVDGPNGVPYDLVVTPKTVIMVGSRRGTIESLAGMIGKPVSVGFVPQRKGNYATRIEVS